MKKPHFLFKFIISIISLFLFAGISNDANAEVISQQLVKDTVTATLSNNQSLFLPPLSLTANLKVNRVTINAENTNLINTWYFDVLYSCFLHPSNGFLFFSDAGKSRSVSTPTPTNISAANLNLEASQTLNGLMFAGQNCNQEQVYFQIIVRNIANDAKIKFYGNGSQIYNVMEDTPPETPNIDMFQVITSDPVIILGECDYQGQVTYVQWSLKSESSELLNRQSICNSDETWRTQEIFNLWNGDFIFEARNDTSTISQAISNFSVNIPNNINNPPATFSGSFYSQPIKMLKTRLLNNNEAFDITTIPLNQIFSINNIFINADNTNAVNNWYFDIIGSCFISPSNGFLSFVDIVSGNHFSSFITPSPVDIGYNQIDFDISSRLNCNQENLVVRGIVRNVSGGQINLYGNGISNYFVLNDFGPNLVDLNQFKSDGVTEAEEGGNVLGTAMTFKANISSSANNQVKLQVELRRTDEFEGEFLNTPTQESVFVDSGMEATANVFDLANGAYHWQARAIDSQGNASAWQEFGEVGNIDFIIKPNPLIIIPGIVGSFWRKTGPNSQEWELVLDPILHTYDDLVAALDNNGYDLDGVNQNLFPFAYDWRETNEVTAQKLANEIERIKSLCECDKVDIIAHSMGGLVARYYIESSLYQDDVDKFIILGTPHIGAPGAYLTWEAGEASPLNFINEKITELVIKATAHFEGFHGEYGTFNYIRNKVLSVPQILPIYDYLRLTPEGILSQYPINYPENIFLENLNSPENLIILNESDVKIYNFAGNSFFDDTIEEIRIVNDLSKLPLWEHGYPENFDNFFGDHGLELGIGDGSVPILSAQALNLSNVEEILINSDHQGLPTNAFDEAFYILTGKTINPIQPQSRVERMLSFMLFSPVDMQIIDPSGRRIGKDFITEQEVNEIPLAYYTGFENSEIEFLTISNPLDGEYQIKTQGTNNGSYEIEIMYFDDASSLTRNFNANTSSEVIEGLRVSLNAEDLELSEIEPEDIAPPVISSTAIIPEYYLNSTPLQFDYSAQDEGVGLFSVSATLDGQTFESGEILTFTSPGTYTIVITAKDLVNNIFTKTISFDVIYNFGGFLNPIRSGGNYNLGRTLPISFQLFDASGQFMPDVIARLTAAKIENGVIGNDIIPMSSSGSDTGNLFRVEGNHYVYNLATSSLGGGTWQLKVTLDDARVYTVIISLY